jgi:hypothetical protein
VPSDNRGRFWLNDSDFETGNEPQFACGETIYVRSSDLALPAGGYFQVVSWSPNPNAGTIMQSGYYSAPDANGVVAVLVTLPAGHYRVDVTEKNTKHKMFWVRCASSTATPTPTPTPTPTSTPTPTATPTPTPTSSPTPTPTPTSTATPTPTPTSSPGHGGGEVSGGGVSGGGVLGGTAGASGAVSAAVAGIGAAGGAVLAATGWPVGTLLIGLALLAFAGYLMLRRGQRA